MRLIYFDSEMGVNFGDQLNELIFPTLLPDYLDNNDESHFLGIGSILGLDFAKDQKSRKVVFSSGFAYGTKPTIDDSYDVICVRGPRTAEALALPKEKAIADGAYLITEIYKPNLPKIYNCSIMLHWHSLEKHDWRAVCSGTGINFIDPRDEPRSILNQIAQSRLVLAEAMHAAIVADALRTPWIPIKCYQGVNAFKWTDFTQSIELPYNPVNIKSLYTLNEQVESYIYKKSKYLINPKNSFTRKLLKFWLKHSNARATPQVVNQLNKLKNKSGVLSDEAVCASKKERLLTALDSFKVKYRRK